MRLRQIEVFNAVYTSGSISNAARMLNVAQPTVSKVLKHAEDSLGFLLFKRLKGKLLPTEEARVLFAETEGIYKQITQLKKISRNLKAEVKGRINIAVALALGIELLPQAIKEYRKLHPEVQFEIQTRHYDSFIPSLLQREKDFGLTLGGAAQAGITKIPLCTAEIVCIYSGSEFDHIEGRLELSDLKGFDFISIEDSGPLGDIIAQGLSEAQVRLDHVIVAQTYFVARNLVALGCGIALVDEFTAVSTGAGSVKYKALKLPLQFTVNVMHLEDRPLSTLNMDFIEFLRKNHFIS